MARHALAAAEDRIIGSLAEQNLFVRHPGGIGAGKSEFMRAVKELGIRTYSADEINAELLRDKRYIEKLSEAFPLAVKDGKVDKSVLREEVFSDEKKPFCR